MPKLKDFLLDLRQVGREEEHRFRQETRHICALYERCFPGLGFATEGWRMVAECVPHVERAKPYCALGVFQLEVQFELSALSRLTGDAWCRMVLDTLHNAALTLAKHEGWPLEPLVDGKWELAGQ
jgi:hypothetical protein